MDPKGGTVNDARISVKLPADLRRQLDARALVERRSLGNLVRLLLAQALRNVNPAENRPT